jgi:hypothetical protein
VCLERVHDGELTSFATREIEKCHFGFHYSRLHHTFDFGIVERGSVLAAIEMINLAVTAFADATLHSALQRDPDLIFGNPFAL